MVYIIRNTMSESIRDQFFRLSKEYQANYEAYISLVSMPKPTDPTALAARNADEAAKLAALNATADDLDRVMTSLQSSDASATDNIIAAGQTIQNYTRQIYEKTGDLQRQQKELILKKDELHSKQKQVEMGVQKNRYRRNLIIILTILNIAMIAVIYYFYNRTGAPTAVAAPPSM